MPRFSAFTPFGQLRFSSKEATGETHFKALLAAYGGAENFDPAGVQAARCYAQAMVLANCRFALERSQNQSDPAKVSDLLATLEFEHGLTPNAADTIAERRQALAERMEASLGSRPGNIDAKLADILGDGFVAHRITPIADIVTSSLTAGILHAAQSTIGILVRLTGSGIGTGEQTFPYEVISGEGQILAGQRLVIQPGHNVRAEVVTVTSTAPGSFTATFANPHDAESYATNVPFYCVSTTRRRHQILMTPTAIRDAESRRKMNQKMRELSRAVTTWETFEEGSTLTAGPFKVGAGRIGYTPIGEVTF